MYLSFLSMSILQHKAQYSGPFSKAILHGEKTNFSRVFLDFWCKSTLRRLPGQCSGVTGSIKSGNGRGGGDLSVASAAPPFG